MGGVLTGKESEGAMCSAGTSLFLDLGDGYMDVHT